MMHLRDTLRNQQFPRWARMTWDEPTVKIMLTRTQRKHTGMGVLCALVLLAAGTGCGWELLGFMNLIMRPPKELPPTLDALLAPGGCDCDDPNALRNMPAEALPVDDLAALDGCWGGCCGTSPRLTGREWIIAETLRFDSGSGVLERVVYQSFVITPPILDIQRGTITLDETGRATFRVAQILSSANPEDPGTLVDISDHWLNLPVYEVQLALDDGQLIAYFSEIDTPRTSAGFGDRQYLAHASMSCE